MVNAILAIFMRFALTRVASIAPFDLHMYYIIGFVCLRVCVSPVCVHTGLIRVACWIVRCSYIVRGCAWHLCSGLDAHLLWQVSRPPYSLYKSRCCIQAGSGLPWNLVTAQAWGGSWCGVQPLTEVQ